jgi:hypothetical protein
VNGVERKIELSAVSFESLAANIGDKDRERSELKLVGKVNCEKLNVEFQSFGKIRRFNFDI